LVIQLFSQADSCGAADRAIRGAPFNFSYNAADVNAFPPAAVASAQGRTLGF
jgi:hypothetical protein